MMRLVSSSITISAALFALVSLDAIAQTPPTSAPASPGAPNKTPKLTPEQRQKYAEAQALVMKDGEYALAVQKAVEAQKAADRIFFSKLLKAAPGLEEYISYLRTARGLTQPARPQ